MKHCRFENRLTGKAYVLDGLRERITADSADALAQAFTKIEQARLNGAWIALLMDYELGEWLEPALGQTTAIQNRITAPVPRLTALVYDTMRQESPWEQDKTEEACITSIRPEISKDEYMDRIANIHQWIEQGEVYQINTTFALEIETHGHAQTLYRNIAKKHPVAFAAFIEDQDRTVLSFSPELFLERSGNRLTTRPMKGTAPRSNNPVQDEQLGQALLRSDKNRAENLMIVDLLRNDLGRVAKPGTIRAEPLFSLEKYPSVWTMTSTIEAEIPEQTSLQAILTALFPCGSVTGAPKIAAMQHIQQTEENPRGLYCGSIGWLAPNGDFCLNVAIRTLVLDSQGTGRYHVGGGIVHDSVAEEEWQECFWKARTLSQEQPSLIETMRSDQHGNIALLELHLDRLTTSAKALAFALPGRDKLRASIESKVRTAVEQAENKTDMRVRLLLEASGFTHLETAPLPPLHGIPKIAAAHLVLDSKHPLLQHKTTFRPWYKQALSWLADHPSYFDLIYFNERGEICEGSRSNIYIKKNGQWLTPALESGLLGGVYRRHLMQTDPIKEGTLTRADLEDPNAEIRLSNGLRGWFDVQFDAGSLLPGDFLP